MTIEQIEQYAYTVKVVFLLLPNFLLALGIRGVMRSIAELRAAAIPYRETRIAFCKVIALLLAAACIAVSCWAMQIPSWLIPAMERDIPVIAGELLDRDSLRR